MKIIFLFSIALLFVMTPAYGGLLSDATGLVERLDIQTGGHSFEVETVSNFAISDYEFDKDEKKLTLNISSGIENNLSEIIIPQNLLGGNLTFYLNGGEYFPKVNYNEKISFIVLNFTGTGDNTLEIVGTTYLSGLTEIYSEVPTPDVTPSVDYDYSMIYVLIIIAILVVGVIGGIIFLKKRK